jgi:organic radical activating enzyme
MSTQLKSEHLMNKLKDTLSVCEQCYRHVPAVRFERDNQIWLSKTCSEHGYVEHLVEPDAEFYLNYNYPRHPLSSYFIETTNKCNLACPHCYQEPDSRSIDPAIQSILTTIKSWPDDGYPLSLVGAEPTVRKDLPEIIEAIQALPGKPRGIMILTNGVKLGRIDYASQFTKFDNVHFTVGLNHPDYQGHTVRGKQEQGLDNCVAMGLSIKNISYTLEGFDQLEYCLSEIQKFNDIKKYCNAYRIRVGTEIGRCPDQDKMYLSELVKRAKAVAEKNNWSFVPKPELGIRAHYPIEINGILIKFIQWPDAKTLDLSEMQTEAIADILPGKPPSPLVHQVILRDHAVNNGKMLPDTIPEEWIKNYGN